MIFYPESVLAGASGWEISTKITMTYVITANMIGTPTNLGSCH